MNVFFYTEQETPLSSNALNWLESLRPALHIQVLPSGLGLRSKESMGLRNGNLIIIFIHNQEDLKILIESKSDYTNYKIYLLFPKHDPKLIEKGLVLNPKHYSSVEENYLHTEETIRQILRQSI